MSTDAPNQTTEVPEHLWKGDVGWRVRIYRPERVGDWWRASAHWGPCSPFEKDYPGYLYCGAGPTEEAARADLLALCAADPKWSHIADD